MQYIQAALAGFLLCVPLASSPVGAQTDTRADAGLREQQRFDSCLDRVDRDADGALEDSQTWRLQGGGWPARHCEALSLIALGEVEVGARMLDALATTPRPGSEMIVRLVQWQAAGEAWLQIDQPEAALASFAAGLALAPDAIELRLGRARAALALGDWQTLDQDAARLVETAPYLPESWSMRSRARLEAGDYTGAFLDVEEARLRAPEDVDILVLRGRILEARRVSGAS